MPACPVDLPILVIQRWISIREGITRRGAVGGADQLLDEVCDQRLSRIGLPPQTLVSSGGVRVSTSAEYEPPGVG